VVGGEIALAEIRAGDDGSQFLKQLEGGWKLEAPRFLLLVEGRSGTTIKVKALAKSDQYPKEFLPWPEHAGERVPFRPYPVER